MIKRLLDDINMKVLEKCHRSSLKVVLREMLQ